MPTHFIKTGEDGDEILPFTRFHYNEVTGERVPTKDEEPNDIFNLTEAQALHLVNGWNQRCHLYCLDFEYAVYDDVE